MGIVQHAELSALEKLIAHLDRGFRPAKAVMLHCAEYRWQALLGKEIKAFSPTHFHDPPTTPMHGLNLS